MCPVSAHQIPSVHYSGYHDAQGDGSVEANVYLLVRTRQVRPIIVGRRSLNLNQRLMLSLSSSTDTTGATKAAMASTIPRRERDVDCIWRDVHNPTVHYRKQSKVPIETLLHTVGKHIALGIYQLAQGVCATPSTLHILMTTRHTKWKFEDFRPALEIAVSPERFDDLTLDQKTLLFDTGLLIEHPTSPSSPLTHAPFPRLWTTSYPSDNPMPEYNPEPIKDNKDLTDEELSQVYETQMQKELEFPDKISLTWSNYSLAHGPHAIGSWMGAYVGTFFGFGSKSTASGIVAEIGRQIGPGMALYRILSLVATPHEVTLMVECDEKDEEKIGAMYNLLQSGGQPMSAFHHERAIKFGLLKPAGGLGVQTT